MWPSLYRFGFDPSSNLQDLARNCTTLLAKKALISCQFAQLIAAMLLT
jgi:hypothetical protein